MKSNTSSVVVASTLGAALSLALAASFCPTLGVFSGAGFALLGGLLGYFLQDVPGAVKAFAMTGREAFAEAKHVLCGALVIAIGAAGAALVWPLFSVASVDLTPLHPVERVLVTLAGTGTLFTVGSMTLLLVFALFSYRTPLGVLRWLPTAMGRWSRASAEALHLFEQESQAGGDYWHGPAPEEFAAQAISRLREGGFGAAAYVGTCLSLFSMACGLAVALVLAALLCVVGLGVMLVVHWAVTLLVAFTAAVTVPPVRQFCWRHLVNLSRRLHTHSRLCAGVGAAIGTVLGLGLSLEFGVMGIPIVAALFGAVGGLMAGAVAAFGSRVVLYFAEAKPVTA